MLIPLSACRIILEHCRGFWAVPTLITNHLSTSRVSYGVLKILNGPRKSFEHLQSVSGFSRITALPTLATKERALSTPKCLGVLQDHSFTHAGHQRALSTPECLGVLQDQSFQVGMDGNLVSHPNVCLHSRIAFQSLFEAANTRARWWSLEVGRGYSTACWIQRRWILPRSMAVCKSWRGLWIYLLRSANGSTCLLPIHSYWLRDILADHFASA